MFRKFIDWVRQVLQKLISKSNVKEKLHIDVAVSDKMSEAISLWSNIYEDKAPWLSETVQSMNLGSAIASEVARLVTIEMESEITGSPRADYLQGQYQVILDNLRTYCEYGCAKGGIAFKPYVDGDTIAVDAVHADRFFPTKFDSAGNITGAVFVERITKGKKYYTRFEYAEMTDAGYQITNKAYESEAESMIGREVSLESVEEWANLEAKALIQNVEKPLFAYFKVAQANAIDSNSPLGVSVYSRAVTLLEEADKQFSRVLWEMEGGELAIDADDTLFREHGTDNLKLPKGKERLFRALKIMSESANPIQVFSPELRDQSLLHVEDSLKKKIEFACGLAYGTISDPQNVDKTAEEIKASKQRSYANVADNQKSLEVALRQLVYAMDVWATIGNLAPKGEYEISFEWDDSIVTDIEVENVRRLQQVQAGILRPEKYYAWYYGVSEEQALKELPGVDMLMDAEGEPRPQNNTDTQGVVDEAEDVAGKALNGAQTQSLIAVIAQYQSGALTIGQAINVISVAIGVSKEEAKKILEGIE